MATELSFDTINQKLQSDATYDPDTIVVAGNPVTLNVYDYGIAIHNLRLKIMELPGSPVSDPIGDLTVDDFRIVADPTE